MSFSAIRHRRNVLKKMCQLMTKSRSLKIDNYSQLETKYSKGDESTLYL
ncbi:MAG TPA: hypothetical protein GX746_04555 [Bacteroidales bacterium]|nr:hypothetical protein [Bacteroidales bacterium]